MTKRLLSVFLATAMVASLAACGGAAPAEAPAAEAPAAEAPAAEEEAPAEEAAPEEAPAEEATAPAGDLNSMSLDDIKAAAQEAGKISSVGMPDGWANWELLKADLEENYGIVWDDNDMSSAEELNMFATEGENGTKDIGDVGFAFAKQAIEQDLVQGYKTTYWDSVPDWAKGEDGKWMVAYTGATTFLINQDNIDEAAPASWADIKAGSYKVSIGDITGGNAQGAIVASAFALGGGSSLDEINLDAAFEFWAEMAEAGRINTVDITEANFESGEVPVGVVWSYTACPYKKNLSEKYEMVANIPADGAILNGYASVINKYAPHPAAAALAREVMFSDAGQEYLAKSGAVPTRSDVVISEEIQADTFPQSAYANAIPVTDAEKYAAICEEIVTRWTEEIQPLLVQ